MPNKKKQVITFREIELCSGSLREKARISVLCSQSTETDSKLSQTSLAMAGDISAVTDGERVITYTCRIPIAWICI